MRNDKLIEIIINKAITRINFLLPKTKKIIIKNFKIKNNKLFDSLNYVTFLIEVDKGEDFDAELHEAITQLPVDDKKMKGKIIDVVESGYKLGDKIIRYPKVVVGN